MIPHDNSLLPFGDMLGTPLHEVPAWKWAQVWRADWFHIRYGWVANYVRANLEEINHELAGASQEPILPVHRTPIMEDRDKMGWGEYQGREIGSLSVAEILRTTGQEVLDSYEDLRAYVRRRLAGMEKEPFGRQAPGGWGITRYFEA